MELPQRPSTSTQQLNVGHEMPEDAKRLGLDTTTGAGQMIYMSSAFRPGKRSHRFFAAVLVVCVLIPVFLSLWSLFSS